MNKPKIVFPVLICILSLAYTVVRTGQYEKKALKIKYYNWPETSHRIEDIDNTVDIF